MIKKIARHRIAILGTLATLGVLQACGEDVSPTQMGSDPGTITMSAQADTATFLGETFPLTAAVFDSDGNAVSGASVTWSSDQSTVATVSASGVVTAVGPGTAGIQASTTSGGGATGFFNLLVRQLPDSVAVTPTSIVFDAPGDTLRLAVSVFDAGGSPMTWGLTVGTGNSGVATITTAGLVTAVGSGSTNVTIQVVPPIISIPVTVN